MNLKQKAAAFASSPSVRLAPHLREFLVVEGGDGLRELVALPDGGSTLVIRLSKGVATANLVGASTYVRRKSLPLSELSIAARFQPGVVGCFLSGESAVHLTNGHVPLASIWPSGAELLLEAMMESSDRLERLDRIEQLLERHLGEKAHPRYTLAARAAALLRAPSATVTAVASRLGLSSRHFRRLFLDQVGLTPKTYSRIARFRNALDLSAAGDGPNWADIAVEAGFYDQSHLANEFRRIAATAPSTSSDLMQSIRDQQS